MKRYILIGLAVLLFGSAYAVLQNYNKDTSTSDLVKGPTEPPAQVSNNSTATPSPTQAPALQPENSAKENNANPSPSAKPSITIPSGGGNANPQKPTPGIDAEKNSASEASTAPDTTPASQPPQTPVAAPTPTAPSQPTNGASSAKNFTLTDLNGNKVSLSDFHGKNVFLNFWATWCPPCRAEMPDLEKIYQKYSADGNLVILTVNLGEDNATVKSFIEKSKFHFPVLLDSDQSVAEKYQIVSIPTSYFLDKEGNIIAKRVGGMSEKQMEDYINLMLK